MANNYKLENKESNISTKYICRRCGGTMLPGKAIENTMSGNPEWPGDTIYTMYPEGSGHLVECLKCDKCGHSETK